MITTSTTIPTEVLARYAVLYEQCELYDYFLNNHICYDIGEFASYAFDLAELEEALLPLVEVTYVYKTLRDTQVKPSINTFFGRIFRGTQSLFKMAMVGHKDINSKSEGHDAKLRARARARAALHELTTLVKKPVLIDRIRIGLLGSQDVRTFNHAAAQRGQPLKTHIALDREDISNYWVDVLEFQGDTLYRVGDAVIKISHYQYLDVLKEPSLYYFSTAFKLHCRLQDAGMGAVR